MDNVHPATWENYERLDSHTVRIYFYSGVEPCSVLDSVRVSYSESEIEVGLFVGSDPEARGMACIMIAEYKATDVHLSQPIGTREITDPHK